MAFTAEISRYRVPRDLARQEDVAAGRARDPRTGGGRGGPARIGWALEWVIVPAAVLGFLWVLSHAGGWLGRLAGSLPPQDALSMSIVMHDDAAFEAALAAGASPSDPDSHGAPPLVTAASAGSRRAAARLVELGADVNAADRLGHTPLIAAARSGDVAVLRALLARGADAGRRDATNRTALDVALRLDSGRVVAALSGK